MDKIIVKQRTFFKEGHTKSYAFRKQQLLKLYTAIENREKEIKEALKLDLNKSSFEAYSTEIGFTLHSISHALKYLKKWMKTQKVKTPYYHGFTKSYKRFEPKGNILIIGPYNYPFQLVIEPLIGAIAAGNTVILKPSEFSSHTEKVIEQLISDTFDPQYVHVICGGVETTQSLLNHRFDHIFFTGSPRVGKFVHQAAAKHLTPVTLELGGKSPAIIDETAKLKTAAKRIAFGKFLNAGQTCIAPDYLFVHESIKVEFLEILKATLDDFYTFEADHYPKIINDKHFDRITALIDPDKVIYGNKTDKSKRLITPTILHNITVDDPIMQEEIFGPLLPVISFTDLAFVEDYLKNQESPLALYMFSESKDNTQKIFDNVQFGGGAINDTITHVANPYLPFGGVGNSGFGNYHGHASFITFSYQKSFVKKSTFIDPNVTYPPYDKKEKLVRKIFK